MASDGKELRGKLVTVLGGSGFFGKHLVQELLARGARLRVASRHPERAFRSKTQANLGQVQFVRLDVTRPEGVAAVVDGSDAVVNLVGAFAGDLDAVQGRGAGKIAAAAKAAGVGAFVHVSAIGAQADSKIDYARTKAEGEAAVLAAFPTATILRPSILFGPDDNFVNMFARLIATLPAMPVFAPEAQLQPLFVDDAAEAVASALANPGKHGGKTYEIAGPEVLSVLELNQRIAAAQGRERWLIELPDFVGSAIATFGFLPGAPITSDQYALLKAGNVANGAMPGLRALGVTPRPLGLFLDRWLVQYRRFGRFGAKAKAG
ncbi:complex I NDUFA9 subunit family protein [Novosphingobium sp. JCM 18896]|uniref:complex I NDUFA9 subunit family protein n=1 Tax=Novosphingobium sp. JCM 18896 TaxID=2989731 RepID=UPI002222DB1A|nr:complex I NDUFA9 subunit family protein [Novosphingobium sp. JCM 18896]MCW1430315.1 complex I NDUFA9 subunit family protein [Novosphingobium sp. JCM 18896]